MALPYRPSDRKNQSNNMYTCISCIYQVTIYKAHNIENTILHFVIIQYIMILWNLILVIDNLMCIYNDDVSVQLEICNNEQVLT